jgi:hypothetical protein
MNDHQIFGATGKFFKGSTSHHSKEVKEDEWEDEESSGKE